MVKTKEEWENNLKEFERLVEENKKNIEGAEKNMEDLDFFMAAVREKIKSFN